MTDLADRIYECALMPELWPGVFDELARIAGARGGFLFTANIDIINWAYSEILHDGFGRFLQGKYLHRTSRVERLIAARSAGFLREYDCYTDDELAADPVYRDLLWPAGLGWAAATVITAPTGDLLVISVERDRANGPIENEAVDRLNDLRPHLARSALMAARLQLERARIASETLAAIGLPALIFDERGKVLAANALIEAMTDGLRWRRQDHFSFRDPIADAQLRTALEALKSDGVGAPLSFAIRGIGDRPSLVAHVVPLRRSARDLFVRCAGILILCPVATPNLPPVELVQSLFDLTPAEARVARQLTAGQTVSEIADGSGTSIATVRTQVRGVLEKTGSRRQAEAIALLSGIADP